MMVTIEQTHRDVTDKWTVNIDPAMTDDQLAEAMVALFGEVAIRPGINLMQFQLKMMRAVQQSPGEGAPAPPDDPPG
jgi:hypothetical protein